MDDIIDDAGAASDINDLNGLQITSEPTSQKIQLFHKACNLV